MMSILGATADDIEEILKGLGYRAEPKPAADVKAKLEALDRGRKRRSRRREAGSGEAAKEAERLRPRAAETSSRSRRASRSAGCRR